MEKDNKGKAKKCFIITPIGNENSSTFRKAKGVIEGVIKPILEKYGFEDVKPAYEIAESGLIGNQIISRIVNDDLVVANLTENNPNVMYELAVRHAVAKPIVHICEKGTTLPFDIKDNRTIFYENDILGARELEEKFQNFVNNIDYSIKYKNNPIYSAIKVGSILDEIENGEKGTEVFLLIEILSLIHNLEKNCSDKCPVFSKSKDCGQKVTIQWDGDMNDYESNEFCKEMARNMKLILYGNGGMGDKTDGVIMMLEDKKGMKEQEIIDYIKRNAKKFDIKNCIISIS